MRLSKMFFTIAMLAGFTLSSMAMAPLNTEPNVGDQIKKMITSSNLEFAKDERVLVNFLINNNDEIIVVSTSQSASADMIRNVINLRKINDNDVERNKIYTLPIQVKKM